MYGTKTDKSCGISLQIGSGDYSAQFLLKLCYTVMANEAVLYQILNINQCRNVSHMDITFTQLIKSKSKRLFKELSLEEMDKAWKAACCSESNYGFHLDLMGSEHIRFSYFNSTLDPEKVRTYVKLTVGILQKAEQLRQVDYFRWRNQKDLSLKQFHKWVNELDLAGDVKIYNHLIKGFIEKDHFA